MATVDHEALVELLRQRPEFAVELLTMIAGVAVPAYDTVDAGSVDLSETVPAEQRADFVATVVRHGKPVLGVVVEVQLRIDKRKHHSWPGYLVSLRNRLRCPVALIVLCTEDRVADWARTPIDLGPGGTITPIAIGPSAVPLVTDPNVARGSPELAMLSALAHPDDHQVLNALAETFDPDIAHSQLYSELIRILLPTAARHHLEHLMASTAWIYEHPLTSDVAKKHYFDGKAEGVAEGEAKGIADSILAVLDIRGITVPENTRTRITGCTEITQLQTWRTRAVTAQTAEDVFG